MDIKPVNAECERCRRYTVNNKKSKEFSKAGECKGVLTRKFECNINLPMEVKCNGDKIYGTRGSQGER